LRRQALVAAEAEAGLLLGYNNPTAAASGMTDPPGEAAVQPLIEQLMNITMGQELMQFNSRDSILVQ